MVPIMNAFFCKSPSARAASVLSAFGWLLANVWAVEPTPQTPRPKPEDSILAAARAGESATIEKLILQSHERPGSFGESSAKEMLDGLVRGDELRAFTVLLDELRKTTLGKDWQ